MRDKPQLRVMKTPAPSRLAFEVSLAMQTVAQQAARARRIQNGAKVIRVWPAGTVIAEQAKR